MSNLDDRIQAEVNRIAPPPLCVAVEAIVQMRPVFEELFQLRERVAESEIIFPRSRK